MPTCQNCDREWTWKQTFKKMFTLDGAMECPYCGAKQYYTKRSRKRTAALTFIIPSVILLNFLDISPYLLVGTYLVVVLSIFGIGPFLVELSNEEESLW